MQDREIVKERIKRRLLAIKGIGPGLAKKAAIQTMDELDRIILETGDRDEEGVRLMERPVNIGSEWNYLIWSTARNHIYLETHKPKPPEYGADHWHINKPKVPVAREKVLHPSDFPYLWDLLPDVPPEERIIRFYNDDEEG